LVGYCELFIEAPAVEIPLKLRNMSLLSIVAAHFIKDLDKDRKQSIELRLADHISFLVDVEENAFGRNGHRTLEIGTKNFVIDTFCQKQVESQSTIDLPIFKEHCKYLEQMRFTRAKEARDPNPVGSFVIIVCIEE